MSDKTSTTHIIFTPSSMATPNFEYNKDFHKLPETLPTTKYKVCKLTFHGIFLGIENNVGLALVPENQYRQDYGLTWICTIREVEGKTSLQLECLGNFEFAKEPTFVLAEPRLMIKKTSYGEWDDIVQSVPLPFEIDPTEPFPHQFPADLRRGPNKWAADVLMRAFRLNVR